MSCVNMNIAEKKLNANQLKIIAIIAMLIDHVALSFLPSKTVLYQIMRAIGKITMPIMCYFIAEGYYKTSNIKKYLLRLILFSLLSHYPFIFYLLSLYSISFNEFLNAQVVFPTSVIFTLLLGLISLIVYDNKNMDKFLKSIIILSLCVIAQIADWGYIGVLWILIFGVNYRNSNNQFLYFNIVSVFFILTTILKSFIFTNSCLSEVYYFGILAAVPLLAQYNGTLGDGRYKWIFYVFYPLHLLILALIRCIII